MRLSHIKLAGFKSFVDPTAIPVPGQLVAVVGPNGCGKSNVIDAVRWVLGESSARQLRGESMQDVIFNGSNTRKPISRASVELVFDNSEGRAAGQWSQYAEISIKRQLTRQGESSYYINQINCRRRDIADLFLGTGVGTRGYAVIEQGMISRIIEARPEELRAFLEEAAGVTKYKDRRKETEGRIADTRDNLARVEDIRNELASQLEKLTAQAEVAGQFNELKTQIVQKQNLLALQRKIDAVRDAEKTQLDLATAQTRLEEHLARLREAEASLEHLREAHYDATDAVQLAQTALSDANAQVARLEQQLLHMQQNRQRLQAQIEQCQRQLEQLQLQQNNIGAEVEAWTERAADAALTQEEAGMALHEEQLAMPQRETAAKMAEAALSEAQLAYSHARQTYQLAQQQIGHLERNLSQLQQRRERLESERRALPQPNMELLADKQVDLEELSLSLEHAQTRLVELEHALHEAEAQRGSHRQTLERLRSERAEVSARHEALHKLQVQASKDKSLENWLRQQGLQDAPRLFRSLRIAPGWETAVEAMLRERMNAIVGDLPPETQPAPARLTIVTRAIPATRTSDIKHPNATQPLLQHVSSDDPAIAQALEDWLGSVCCAHDDAELPTLQTQLTAGGIAVAPSGNAVSRHAVHYHAPDSALSGVLQRERELADLASRLAHIQPELDSEATRLQSAEQKAGELHTTLKHERSRLDALRQQRGERQVEVARLRHAAEQAESRAQALQDQINELGSEAGDLAQEKAMVEDEAQQAAAGLPELERTVELAKVDKVEAETALDIQRGRLRQAERQAQEAGFARQNAAARLAELQRRSGELQRQIEEAETRRDDASFDLAGIDEADFDVGFQAAINRRLEHERTVAQRRDALNAATNQLRERELEKQQWEQSLEPLRNAQGELRLKEQEARLLAERFTQELVDAGADEAALLPLLGDGLKVSSLVGEIGKLTQRINALGNVNLAALDELNAASERKNYLDAQAADLTEAMDTLESAIRKIDRETRAMLQDTFDKVNASLQSLFPTLFGGGHAELILTGDEILDAGIQIMAQPPGKKNSTIHLLSGGEKALTALSLVFSLFQLNPAPFCLLDEVDAPLDDANTERFCKMVKRMAERTQFLYISHNKITMEMADQLIGITMQEQGVSRVVAVDIQEALQMREMTA